MSRVACAVAFLFLVCAALPAPAQEVDAASYDGTWAVRLQGEDGKHREATVVIAGYDGTWQERGGAKNACGGKKVPITVQSSTRSVVAFTVWGETIAAACPTLSVLVRPSSEKMLEGSADVGVSDRDALDAQAVAAAAAKKAGAVGAIRLARR